MKAFLILALSLISISSVYADTYVHGYTRQNGTYVAPHYRSNSDGNVYNNYSTQGNVNPYTGQYGTVNPNPNPYNLNSNPSTLIQPYQYNGFQRRK